MKQSNKYTEEQIKELSKIAKSYFQNNNQNGEKTQFDNKLLKKENSNDHILPTYAEALKYDCFPLVAYLYKVKNVGIEQKDEEGRDLFENLIASFAIKFNSLQSTQNKKQSPNNSTAESIALDNIFDEDSAISTRIVNLITHCVSEHEDLQKTQFIYRRFALMLLVLKDINNHEEEVKKLISSGISITKPQGKSIIDLFHLDVKSECINRLLQHEKDEHKKRLLNLEKLAANCYNLHKKRLLNLEKLAANCYNFKIFCTFNIKAFDNALIKGEDSKPILPSYKEALEYDCFFLVYHLCNEKKVSIEEKDNSGEGKNLLEHLVMKEYVKGITKLQNLAKLTHICVNNYENLDRIQSQDKQTALKILILDGISQHKAECEKLIKCGASVFSLIDEMKLDRKDQDVRDLMNKEYYRIGAQGFMLLCFVAAGCFLGYYRKEVFEISSGVISSIFHSAPQQGMDLVG